MANSSALACHWTDNKAALAGHASMMAQDAGKDGQYAMICTRQNNDWTDTCDEAVHNIKYIHERLTTAASRAQQGSDTRVWLA
jgi:hypothetical protein